MTEFVVDPAGRTVYLRAGDTPGPILALPDVRTHDLGAERVVAVPFTLAHCFHLRAHGVPVPSPIGYEYDWPKVDGLHPPRAHQRETAAFLTLHHRAYCLNEIGTGKTYSALWAADYLKKTGYVRKVLIVAPLSTLKTVWQDSIHRTFTTQRAVVLHGEARRRRELFRKDADYYIVNHDGLEVLCEKTYDQKKRLVKAELPRDDIDLVIIDELAVYRNFGTNRWAVMNRVLKPDMWAWGLTGTPTPNAPTDAWAQSRLLTPARVPRFFKPFQAMTMVQVSEYRWVPRKEALKIVYDALQPSIRWSRDQAYDLPPVVYSDRECDLTPAQAKHYRELANECVTEFGDGSRVTAVNEGVKLSKLLQVVCGVVYTRDHDAVTVECTPRLRVLSEIIEEAGQKVIVFVPFRAVMDLVVAHVRKQGWSAEVIHGSVPAGERNRIYADFQTRPDPHVLVAEPRTMSHGLTLTEASTIVWYGLPVSNEVYTQANGRITREGQRHTANVIHIVSSQVERRLAKSLAERGKLQGLLLDMVRTGKIMDVNE